MTYDIVVIGGGHAGCEAAAVAARMGASVALVTFARGDLGTMSCNPAIGGVGKGHLVREIDAMDGIMAHAADASGIHYRMLNSSKGKAVQGPRVQADRIRYASAIQAMIAEAGVDVVEGEVRALSIQAGRVIGVQLADEHFLSSGSVVIATGTFLNARMFRGKSTTSGGRAGGSASNYLADQVRALGLRIGRLKTGTPPRLDGRTIDWQRLTLQPSDAAQWTMSPLSATRSLPQVSCAVTRTNPATHDIVHAGLAQSPLRSGAIGGSGPRYCPSIEDKIDRFPDREGHQIFLEPEGLDTSVVYPNGISTSLPPDVQADFVRTINGLKRVRIVQSGYAVAYDYIDPRSLSRTLALADMPGLYFAGQINGTTGYEEAAGQGLVAGLNAAAAALGREPILFDRASSYLGVMIDDLVLQGVTEPYRMLTARAEFRLRLRADNAETRLFDTGVAASCLSPTRYQHHQCRRDRAATVRLALQAEVPAAKMLPAGHTSDAAQRSLFDWMRFPEAEANVASHVPPELRGEVADEVLEDARYAPYLQRQDAQMVKNRRDGRVRLPAGLSYRALAGLSAEMVERLTTAQPRDLDEASRIRGITPAALSAILVAAHRAA